MFHDIHPCHVPYRMVVCGKTYPATILIYNFCTLFRCCSRSSWLTQSDLFGRGFSDAPSPLHHHYDSCLYFSQILLCLQSSPISWSGHRSFTIIGYSLGGAIAADFTSYFPYQVCGLILVAPGGLIRTKNITFKSKLLYQSSWLPEWMVHRMVANRLWTGKSHTATVEPEPEALENAETTTSKTDADTRSVRSGKSSRSSRSDHSRKHKSKRRESSPGRAPVISDLAEIDEEDHEGGAAVFLTSNKKLLRGKPQSTVSAVVDWQVLHHKGFVPAFVSSIRYAPVHEQHHRWSIIKENIESGKGPLKEVWLVLGETDPIIIKEELIEDATAVLGEDNLQVRVVEGAGHEVAVERADEIVQVVGSVLGWHKKPHSSKSKKRSFF